MSEFYSKGLARYNTVHKMDENVLPNKPSQSIQSINSRHLHSLIDAGYMPLDQADKIYKNNGYALDKRFSNDKHHVVTDKHDQVYVNFRGSNNMNDVVSDVYLALGLEDYNNRFINSSKLVKNVRKEYKDRPIIGIGHSLGGSLVDHVNNERLLDKGITVNKGIGLSGLGQYNMLNQTDIRTITDPVSILAMTQKGRTYHIPKSFNIDPLYAHSYKQLRKFNKKQRF